mgnify:FL=1
MLFRSDALESVRVAVTLAPHISEYHLMLAEILHALEKRDECINVLRKLPKFIPSNPNALIRFANLAFDVGMIDEAYEILQKLIAIDDTNAQAYYLIGRIYRLRNDLQKAMSALRQAIKLRPSFKEAQRELNLIKPLSLLSRRRTKEDR